MRRLIPFLFSFLFIIANSYSQDDGCNGAAAAMVDGTILNGEDNTAATPDNDYSLEPGGCDAIDYENSLWYSFVATSSYVEITLTPNGAIPITDPVLTLVNGCTVGTVFFNPNCDIDAADISTQTIETCNLNITETYFFMVSSSTANAGMYDLELNMTGNGVANDLCGNSATSGTVSCTNPVSETVNEPNACTDPEATCVSATAAGVWYDFTVDASVSFMSVTGNDFELFEGSNCTSLTSLGCNNVANFVPDPSTSYFVLVLDGGDYTAESDFAEQTMSGDNCNQAMVIGSGTTSGFTFCQSADHNLCGGNPADTDAQTIWYSYTTVGNASLDISVASAPTNPISDLSLVVFEDCTGTVYDDGDADPADTQDCGATLGSIHELSCVPQNTTILIAVGSSSVGEGEFEITITENPITIPSNEDCSNADTSIPIGGGTAQGTTTCASPSTNPYCSNSGDHVVYYEYTVSSTSFTNVSISFASITGTGATNLAAQVWDDCSEITTDVDMYVSSANPVCDVLTDPILMECVPPNTSFTITVGSESGATGDFEITVTEDNVGVPANDICSGAEQIVIVADCESQNVMESSVGACPEYMQTGTSCDLSEDAVVWFQVDIPAGGVGLGFENLSANVQLVLYDDCPNDGGNFVNPPNCFNTDTEILGLNENTTYYIAASLDNAVEGNIIFDIKTIVPPANDECDDVVVITAGGPILGTNVCATADEEPTCTPGTDQGMINTVWYEYTVPTGMDVKQVTISVAPAVADPIMGDIYIAAYESGCGNTNPYQADPISETCVGDDIILSCPTEGDVIQILVGSTSANEGVFDITITEAMPMCPYTNDECADAVVFNSSNPIVTNDPAICETACSELACPDPEMDAACGGVVGNVVWFSIQTDNFDDAVETFITASIEAGSYDPTELDPVIQVFSGACGALNPIGPCANAETTGPISNVDFMSIDPLSTYFIAVGNADPTLTGGNFTLCVDVTQGCVNDLCDDAIILINEVLGNGGTSTVNCNPDEMTCPDAESTVWFSYTLPVSMDFTAFEIEINQTTATGCMTIQAGTMVDCMAPVFEAQECCANNLVVHCAQPGEEYLIQVGTTMAGVGDFEITVTGLTPPDPDNPSPDNDVCSGAIVLTPIPDCELTPYSGDNTDACPEEFAGLPCNMDTDNVIWFEYTLPADGVGIEFDDLGAGVQLTLWNGCPSMAGMFFNMPTDCIIDNQIFLGLTGGDTYFISASLTGGTEGTVDFSVNAIVPPENDAVCDAITVVSECGTTACATPEITGVNCPDNINESTVWYSFVAGPDQGYIISLTDWVSDTPASYGFEIFSSMGGCDLSDLFFEDLNDCGSAPEKELILTCPVEGDTYFIVIGSAADNPGTFCLEVTPDNCDPLPDVCTDAGMVAGSDIMMPITGSGPACSTVCSTYACSEAADACGASNSVWFLVQTDGQATSAVWTIGADYPTATTIYSGTDCTNIAAIPSVAPCNTSTLFSSGVGVNSSYWVQVESINGMGGMVDLCVTTQFNAFDCYTSTAEPIRDNPNVPQEGPYCQGEKIMFCYEVDFIVAAGPPPMGNNTQWIQGIVPVVGNGWDIAACPLNIQGPPGPWSWFNEGDVDYNFDNPNYSTFTLPNGKLGISYENGTGNMMAGDLLPAGWYATSNGGAGCANDGDVDNMWGLNPNGANPQMINFCFELQVKTFDDPVECADDEGLADLSIAIFVFADGETGCWMDISCALSVPWTFDPQIDCNGSSSPMLVADSPICSEQAGFSDGNPFIIADSPSGQTGYFSWTVDDDITQVIGYEEDFIQGPTSQIVIPNQELVNCETTPQDITYFVSFQETPESCPGPPQEIIITVLPKLMIEPPEITECLPFELTLNADDFVTGGMMPYTTISWLWNGSDLITTGNILSNYNLTESGFILVQVTDANGCMFEEQIEIGVFAELNPILNIDSPDACPGDPASVFVDIQLTQGGPGVSWDWTVLDSDGLPFNLGSSNGDTYQINTFGNTPGVYSITVNVENATGCSGESEPILFTLYQEPGGVIVPQTSGGCDNFVELCIEFYAPDGSDIYNNGPDANGDGIPDLFDTDMNGEPTFLDIVWETPNGNISTNELCFDAFVEGIYSAFIITDKNCLGNIEGAQVTLPTPDPPAFVSNGPICEGETFELEITPQTYANYLWTDAAGNPIGGNSASISIMPTVTTTYSVQVEDGDGCMSTISTTVNVNPLPVISFSGSTAICPMQETVIDAGGDPLTWTYVWTDSGSNVIMGDSSSVELNTAGIYTVVVTNEFGCMATGMITIEVSNQLSPSISGEDICDNGMAILDGGSGFDTYQWIDIDGITEIGTMQTVSVSTPGVYTLNVDQAGCEGSETHEVNLVSSPVIDIPDQVNVCNVNSGSGATAVDLVTLASGSAMGNWSSLDGIDISDLSNVSFLGAAVDCYRFVYETNTAIVPCSNPTDTLTICVTDCQCPNPTVVDQTICNTILEINLNNQITATTDSGAWNFNAGPEMLMITMDSIVTTDGILSGVYEFVYVLDPVPAEPCEATDTFFLTVVSPPVPEFAADPSVCSAPNANGTTTLDLSTILMSGSGTWIDPLIGGLDFSNPNSLDFDEVAEGSYTIDFETNDAMMPCANQTFSITVNVINCDCPILTLQDGIDLCNDSGIFDLTSLEGGSDAGTWEAATSNPGTAILAGTMIDLMDQPAGLYLFTYTLDNILPNCPEQDNVIISLIAAPQAEVMNTTACNTATGNGSTIVDLTSLVTGDAGVWTDSNGVPVPDPTMVDFDEETVGATFDFIFTTTTAETPTCTNISRELTVTVTDCNCSDPEFASPPTLCNVAGENVDLQDLLVSGPNGQWSLIDQPAGGTASLTGTTLDAMNILAGAYTVQYTLDTDPGAGCQVDFPLIIMVTNQLTAELMQNSTVCTTDQNGENTSFDLSSVITSGETNGVWRDDAGNVITNTLLEFLDETPGTFNYTYTVENTAPCQDVVLSFGLVAEDCTCPSVATASPGTYCNSGGILELLVDFTITSEPGQWYLEDGTIINNNILDYTGLLPGIYGIYFQLDNPITDCPDTTQQNFTIVAPADLGQALEVRVCGNEADVIDLISLLPDANCASGFWEEVSLDGSTGGAFDAANGTFDTDDQLAAEYRFQYNCEATAPCSEVSEVVSVIIEGIPLVDAGQNQMLTCLDNIVEIGNTAGTSLGSNFSYMWTEASGNTITDPTTPTIEVTEQGVYTLVVIDNNTMCQVADIVEVSVDSDLPILETESQNIDCFGANNGALTVIASGGIGNIAISIDGGQTFGIETVYTNLDAGTYQVVIRDDNGCEKEVTVILTEPPALAVNLGPDLGITTDDTQLLTFSTTPENADLMNIEWSIQGGEVLCSGSFIDCSTIEVAPDTSTTYCIVITDQNGCVAEDCLQLRATVVRDVYIANTFSPNGDGQNDIFFVQSDKFIVGVPVFRIFDRWGELIFTGKTEAVPNNPDFGWDGLFNGNTVVPGVYVYHVQVVFENGETRNFSGDITLIR